MCNPPRMNQIILQMILYSSNPFKKYRYTFEINPTAKVKENNTIITPSVITILLGIIILFDLVCKKQKMKLQLTILLIFSLYSCANSQDKSVISKNMINEEIDTLWVAKIDKPDSYWKEKVSDEQFYVTRRKGTERSFSHPYNKNKKDGLYLCSSCNNPLFESDKKFDSGTGWPSFWDPYFSKSVSINGDHSQGMVRDEIVCARCDAHLGHVFNDGPKPTGLRYCINGTSLMFSEEQALKKAVFAQGCFWCVEEIFEAVKGVKSAVSGYAGGTEKNPTYEAVGRGNTAHAESVEITYDSNQITYKELLKVYFNSGDITQINGQGNDIGKQYRSIVFYNSKEEKEQVKNYIGKLEASGSYSKPIAVEVLPFKKFYKAEDYHQDFVKLNPNQGYVRNVSIPRYKKAIKKFPELLK